MGLCTIDVDVRVLKDEITSLKNRLNDLEKPGRKQEALRLLQLKKGAHSYLWFKARSWPYITLGDLTDLALIDKKLTESKTKNHRTVYALKELI